MARSNTTTKFMQDIVDDTKDFVDELLDRTKNMEDSGRDGVRDANDKGDAQEVEALRKSLEDLRTKIDEIGTSAAKS